MPRLWLRQCLPDDQIRFKPQNTGVRDKRRGFRPTSYAGSLRMLPIQQIPLRRGGVRMAWLSRSAETPQPFRRRQRVGEKPRQIVHLPAILILEKPARARALEKSASKPYDIYQKLDLGSGGYARAPAKDAKRAVADVIARKYRR